MNLLVVDDEYFTRKGIVEAFPWDVMGIERIEQAEDGVHALEKISGFRPDVIVTDVRMPRMDGIEMSRHMRKQFPDCQIIFMSGYSDREYLKSAIHLGAVNFVDKPFELAEMRQGIEHAVDRCKQQAILHHWRELLRTGTSAIKTDLALQLIQAGHSEAAVPEWSDLASQLKGAPYPFVTLIVKFLHPVEKFEPVYQALEDTLTAVGSQGIMAFKDEFHLIVHLYRSTNDNHPNNDDIVSSFCHLFTETLRADFRFLIGVGRESPSISGVFDSYATAVQSLQIAFYRDVYETVLSANTVQQNSPSYEFPEQALGELQTYLTQDMQQNAESLIRSLVRGVKRHEHTPVNHTKDYFFKLLLVMNKFAEERGFSLFDQTKEEQYLWELIFHCQTLDEIEQFLLLKIRALLSQTQEKSSSIIVAQVMKYIHRHYDDDEMTVTAISRHLYLSTTHICVVFKEQTKKTILQYMTEYRIEKSKDLLKDPQTKIGDIAARVGYSNSRYFAKVFRKHTGLTPSEFRERTFS
ncbi:response regulator [Cohnella hongkongensis]|uniref:Response regulator n=1 Tax=Cohnella hongkongensis TaxID=178337 RepID=A0ABV9F5X0_9BACL